MGEDCDDGVGKVVRLDLEILDRRSGQGYEQGHIMVGVTKLLEISRIILRESYNKRFSVEHFKSMNRDGATGACARDLIPDLTSFLSFFIVQTSSVNMS